MKSSEDYLQFKEKYGAKITQGGLLIYIAMALLDKGKLELQVRALERPYNLENLIDYLSTLSKTTPNRDTLQIITSTITEVLNLHIVEFGKNNNPAEQFRENFIAGKQLLVQISNGKVSHHNALVSHYLQKIQALQQISQQAYGSGASGA